MRVVPPVAEVPLKRTVLRDVYEGPGSVRVTVLADHLGEMEERRGFFARFGERVVRTNNEVLGAVTGLPGQLRDNWRLLRDPVQLRLLMRSLVDDSLMTARRRRAVFSIFLWGSLMVWGAVGLALAIADPRALVTYQSVYSLFFYSLATSLLLPIPFEFILSNAAAHLGVLLTVLVAALGKVAGSWLVLMMGDRANQGLQELLKRRALLRRAFHRLMAFAQKYGYFAIFVIFAIPFMTDTAPLFILAVLRMKKLPFLAVTFVAIVVRSLIWIYAGDAWGAVLDWARALPG